jgi:hypothetical protein
MRRFMTCKEVSIVTSSRVDVHLLYIRVPSSRFHRCARPLVWSRRQVPSAIMGTRGFPCVWYHNVAQVGSPLLSQDSLSSSSSPSATNVGSFAERARVESGKMIGSRIFSTGQALYSYEVVDEDDAHSTLTRLKMEGGPASFSYKNYQLPSRWVYYNVLDYN